MIRKLNPGRYRLYSRKKDLPSAMKSGILLALAALTAAGPLHGAGIAFDDFERHLLGPDWTVLSGAGSLGPVGDSDLGLVNGPARGGAVGRAADDFAADQFSEALISPDRPDSMLHQVFVRLRAADNARYGFHWNNAFGGRWEIKFDGVPTQETRILASVIAPQPLAGDRIRIEAAGSTVSGYHNGVLVLQAEDTAPDAITGTGRLGMVFRFTLTVPATYPSAVIEEWTGGDLPASSAGSADPAIPAPLVTIDAGPATSTATVRLSPSLEGERGLTFSVHDVRGRLMVRYPLHAPGDFVLDVRDWTSGVYFYRLAAARPLATGRFVVQR